MRAIILAAGQGKRCLPYTAHRPKCLVELGGSPLLTQQVDALRCAGVEAVTIVVGHGGQQILSLGFPTRCNPDFARTNMVASLMRAADLLDGSDDVLIVYGDIVFEPRIIDALTEATAPISVTVDLAWRELWEARTDDPLADAETLKLDGQGNVIELGKQPTSLDEIEGQYMGLIKVRADAAPGLVEFYRNLDPQGTYDGQTLPNMYMTSFLQALIDTGHPVAAVPVERGWLEIDTAADLELYNRLDRQGRLAWFYQPAAVLV